VETERNGNGTATVLVEDAVQQRQTPSELLEDVFQTMRQDLAQDLLERIKACSPVFFEAGSGTTREDGLWRFT
jgi:restriction system protein